MPPLPPSPTALQTLARGLAVLEPWKTYGLSVHALEAYFLKEEPGVERLAFYEGDEVAGLVVLKNNWLFGPYIAFFGVLPAFQGKGIGARMLRAIEQRARTSSGNAPKGRHVFLCVSAFNTGAKAFYEKQGFAAVGLLPDLVKDGIDEILMRKNVGAET